MSPLPRFVVLKSAYNGKYLTKVRKEVITHAELPETFLSFHGEDITSPFAKFEVEIAKKNPEFVHIRCCLNNKYLVRDPTWIVASADQPLEDVHNYSCTMFKPIQAEMEGQFRFLHVYSGHYACLWRVGEPYADGLYPGSTSVDGDHCDQFKVLDWESLVIFPKIATFKLSGRSEYLGLRSIEGHPYLQLVSADCGDRTIANEISTSGDGYVRIRSVSNGYFWRRSPNWIWADSSDTTAGNSDTLFWPIKLADNVVALRNLGNNHFCKILTADGKTGCMNAAEPNIVDLAKFEVAEWVISRSIYNISFRPEEGRVYGLKVIKTGKEHADNYTCDWNTVTLKFSYKETRSSTFGGSVSLNVSVKSSLQVEVVPEIVEGKIELSAELSATVQWGETKTVETETEATYSVKVPPMTRTIVTMTATQGMCDVPFSYTQRDTLYDGNHIIQNMEDGIYTGINMFGIQFDSRHEKLPKS